MELAFCKSFQRLHRQRAAIVARFVAYTRLVLSSLVIAPFVFSSADAEPARPSPVRLPPSSVTASNDDAEPQLQHVALNAVDLRGWDYIANRFVDLGVEPRRVEAVFSDPRLPRRETLLFSITPKESSYNYRKLNTAKNRKAALACYHQFRSAFDSAEKRFGVPASVIVSIVQVETACGKNTGGSQVFHRLLRLAAAATPDNVEQNIEEKRLAFRTGATPELDAKVRERAKYLEETFLPHAAAAIDVAQYKKIDLFELSGSGAGAVGMPQFLPGHYLNFGIDGNKDGRVDLSDGADAIPAVGNYLQHFGWNVPNPSTKTKRSVIWEYNRSEPYIDTVLGMAKALSPQIIAARDIGQRPRIQKLIQR